MQLDSAAIGALIGFAGRAGPELLKFIDTHLDRRHEIAMQELSLRAAKEVPHEGGKAMALTADAGQLQDAMSMMREAYQQQFNGAKDWLNTISILVRPVTTGLIVLLYVTTKAVQMAAAFMEQHTLAALLTVYTEVDVTILMGILAFWFADRSLFKR